MDRYAMIILFILLCTCSLGTCMLGATNFVTGKVVNHEGIGLEYATVSFQTTDSVYVNRVTTDGAGQYFAELNRTGDIIAEFRALGYVPTTLKISINNDTTTIPPVILELSNNTLSEVTVSGSLMTRVDNHLLIIPDRMSVKHSFSAYQLLYNIKLPGFDVVPQSGIVKLFGNNVSLYIDGQPADYNLVKNLRSKDVEKIEYHDIPTGRYSQDYAAINFITKKYKFGGYANLDAQQCIGHLNGTYEAYAQIASGNTKYHVSGGYSMWDMSRDSKFSSETYKFQENPVVREDQTNGGNTKRNNEYGQFRIENSSNKRQFSIQASMVHSRNSKDMNNVLKYSSPYDILETSYSRSKENYTSPSISGYAYIFLPANQWLSISAATSYTNRSMNSLYSVEDNSIPNGAKEDYFTASSSFSYGKTFKHNNSFFAVISESFTSTSIDYDGSFNSWKHMWDSKFNGTVSYRHKIKKVSLNAQLGLTITQMRNHGRKLLTEKLPNTYVELVYRPTPFQQLRASGSVGSGNTPLSYMTDGEIQTDFLNIRQGNPFLKRDMYYYTSNLNYSITSGKFNIASSVTLGKQKNAIFNSYYLTADKLVQTYNNGDLNYLYGTVSLTWSANKSLRFNMTGIYRHKENISDKSKYHNCLSGQLKGAYYWRDFNFNLSLDSPVEYMTDWAITKSDFKYNINIGWNHKNWSISAWTSNPFRRFKETTKMNVPAIEQYSRTIQQRAGFVKVIYTFDFGKKVQHTGVDRVNTSAGSAIL